MYAKNKNTVTYFVEENAKHTEKVFYGRVSESFKAGKDDEGKDKYEFESWNVRFVGKAKEKAEKLADKTRITLTEWAAHNPYDKEKKRNFPYIMVMDFEVSETTEKK